MSKKARPTGITILAALEILAGIAYLLGAVALMVAGALIPLTELPMFLSALAGAFGFVLLILALVSFSPTASSRAGDGLGSGH